MRISMESTGRAPLPLPLRLLTALLGFAMLAVLGGCVAPPPQANDPSWAPVYPKSTTPPPPSNGAIYQHGYNVTLFEDSRAKRVGDVLTIVLQEVNEAETESETTINKNSNTDIANPTILGQTVDSGGLPGALNSLVNRLPLSGGNVTSLATDLSSSSNFSGDADSDQKHDISGTITVVVHDVLPNGLLYVRGEKWVKVNQSNEYIRVSGLVRPEDISARNSVISTQLADARIEFSGTGAMSNAQTPGWLTKVFLSPLWLF